jgi:hypothetical protein
VKQSIAYPVQIASRLLLQVFERRFVRYQKSIYFDPQLNCLHFSESVQLQYPRRGFTKPLDLLLSKLLMDVNNFIWSNLSVSIINYKITLSFKPFLEYNEKINEEALIDWYRVYLSGFPL